MRLLAPASFDGMPDLNHRFQRGVLRRASGFPYGFLLVVEGCANLRPPRLETPLKRRRARTREFSWPLLPPPVPLHPRVMISLRCSKNPSLRAALRRKDLLSRASSSALRRISPSST